MFPNVNSYTNTATFSFWMKWTTTANQFGYIFSRRDSTVIFLKKRIFIKAKIKFTTHRFAIKVGNSSDSYKMMLEIGSCTTNCIPLNVLPASTWTFYTIGVSIQNYWVTYNFYIGSALSISYTKWNSSSLYSEVANDVMYFGDTTQGLIGSISKFKIHKGTMQINPGTLICPSSCSLSIGLVGAVICLLDNNPGMTCPTGSYYESTTFKTCTCKLFSSLSYSYLNQIFLDCDARCSGCTCGTSDGTCCSTCQSPYTGPPCTFCSQNIGTSPLNTCDSKTFTILRKLNFFPSL